MIERHSLSHLQDTYIIPPLLTHLLSNSLLYFDWESEMLTIISITSVRLVVVFLIKEKVLWKPNHRSKHLLSQFQWNCIILAVTTSVDKLCTTHSFLLVGADDDSTYAAGKCFKIIVASHTCTWFIMVWNLYQIQ